MAHAFLFDNRDSYASFFKAVKDVLTSYVLKGEDSAYVIRMGDLLFSQDANSIAQLADIALTAIGAVGNVQIRGEEFVECLTHRNLFCVVIEGMDASEAELLHGDLQISQNYLGFHPLKYSFPIQLKYYRNFLPRKFRIYNNKLEVLYKMGDTDGIDPMWVNELGEYFQSASNEDDGAHDTVFDDFDTIEHFKRVEFYKEGLARLFGVRKANSSVLLIEDINPKLSDNIFSAIKAIESFETTEDSAQVSVSMRRFTQAVADTLFPARRTGKGERPLHDSAYRNRIWQYITNAYKHEPHMIPKLGQELERVDEVANKGTHKHISREEAQQLIDDILSLTRAITRPPAKVRQSGLG